MSDKIISFSYVGFYVKDHNTGEIIDQIFRPVIPIRISYGHHISRTIEALVDSGSDRNLFPAQIGEAIGINFRKVKPIFITGIGDKIIKAFPCRIKIFIGTDIYDTDADFSFEQRAPLLGRQGFFNLFNGLKFKEKNQFLDIYL